MEGSRTEGLAWFCTVLLFEQLLFCVSISSNIDRCLMAFATMHLQLFRPFELGGTHVTTIKSGSGSFLAWFQDYPMFLGHRRRRNNCHSLSFLPCQPSFHQR